jgi:hypothetical protein
LERRIKWLLCALGYTRLWKVSFNYTLYQCITRNVFFRVIHIASKVCLVSGYATNCIPQTSLGRYYGFMVVTLLRRIRRRRVCRYFLCALQLTIIDQLLYYCMGTFIGSRTTRLSILSEIGNSTWPPRGNLREISSFLVCTLQVANIEKFFTYFVCMCYWSGSARLSILAPIQNPRWPPLQILYVVSPAKRKSAYIS